MNDHYLTNEDIQRLLEASKGNCALHDAVQLIFSTGIRPRELARLQWKHVNFATGTMSFPGKNGNRLVMLDDATREVLQTRMERQFVFGPHSHSLLARLNQQLRAVAAILGFNLRTLRDLRAALAASLLQLNPPKHIAAEIAHLINRKVSRQ